MLVPILSAVLASTPTALVLLLGLGAAAWVWRRSPASGLVLAGAVVILGIVELMNVVVDIALSTPILWSLGPEAVHWLGMGLTIAVSLGRGLGIVGLLAAACMGPAPGREAK